MKSWLDPRKDMLLGVSIVGVWISLTAYMESVVAGRVPDGMSTGLVWGLPALGGFVAFAFMLNRVANALAEQNLKLVKAEKAAARTAAELEAVLESIADPMMVHDRKGNLVRTNQALAETIGTDIAGLDFEKLHRADGAMPIYREDQTTLTRATLPCMRALAGQVVSGETLMIRRGRTEEYFLASAAPVWDPHTRQIMGAVTTLKDISELKRLERLKDEFISTTSHELRTPLAVIRGYAELQLLADRRQDTDRNLIGPEAAARIVSEVDRMVGLIDQMLQIARLDSGVIRLSRQDVDLAKVIGEEISALAVTTTPGRFETDVEAGGGKETFLCRIDLNAFRQILGNLVSNAVKYSPEQTLITVRLRAAAGEAVLSVADRGVGVPPEELPMIFEKFYRSTNVVAQAAGLGLGLYITSRLVELHGGRIWAESTLGEGSTFYVAFPLAPKRLRTGRQKAPNAG